MQLSIPLKTLLVSQIQAALAHYYEAPAEIEAEPRAEDDLVMRMAGRYAPHMAGSPVIPTSEP
jgi:hypothetical protein